MSLGDIGLHIGRQIRTRRRLMDLTQAELGQRCGLSFQTIHKFEAGIVNISAAQLYKLAQALGVASNYFFDGFERLDNPRKADGRMERRVQG